MISFDNHCLLLLCYWFYTFLARWDYSLGTISYLLTRWLAFLLAILALFLHISTNGNAWALKLATNILCIISRWFWENILCLSSPHWVIIYPTLKMEQLWTYSLVHNKMYEFIYLTSKIIYMTSMICICHWPPFLMMMIMSTLSWHWKFRCSV